MSLVCVCFFPFLGDEQELVKEEESSLILGSLQPERSFKNKFSIRNEIRTLPVGQKTLDFLQEASKGKGLLKNKQTTTSKHLKKIK